MTARRQENKGRPIFVSAALLAAVLLHGAWAAAYAAGSERVVSNRLTGLAVEGVDPIAYFADGAPIAGRAEIEATALGVIWRFRSEQNRAVFLAHPDIYAPQFGGYDPVDAARGVIGAGQPRIWLVAGQRLFLFSREDNRDAFVANVNDVLAEARRRWPALKATLADY